MRGASIWGKGDIQSVRPLGSRRASRECEAGGRHRGKHEPPNGATFFR